MLSLVQELLLNYQSVHRYLLGRLRNRHQAEDIAQTTFERVYALVASSAPEVAVASPRALLFEVARNLCIDEARRQQHAGNWAAEHVALHAHSAVPCSEFLVAQRQMLAKVVQVLENLPPRRRTVFILFRAYGHSRSDIAAQLGITEMAVAKHVVRATLDCAKAFDVLREAMPEPPLSPGGARPFLGLAEEFVA